MDKIFWQCSRTYYWNAHFQINNAFKVRVLNSNGRQQCLHTKYNFPSFRSFLSSFCTHLLQHVVVARRLHDWLRWPIRRWARCLHEYCVCAGMQMNINSEKFICRFTFLPPTSPVGAPASHTLSSSWRRCCGCCCYLDRLIWYACLVVAAEISLALQESILRIIVFYIFFHHGQGKWSGTYNRIAHIYAYRRCNYFQMMIICFFFTIFISVFFFHAFGFLSLRLFHICLLLGLCAQRHQRRRSSAIFSIFLLQPNFNTNQIQKQ